MVAWKIDEFTLTTFHLKPSFHRDLIDCMTPWFRLTSDLRLAILNNARDASRKDQWVWMKRYEKMLMEKRGEAARFLPQDEEKPNARSAAARPEPEAGPAFVDFSEQ